MTTVVQTNYFPTIRPGFAGMIADMTNASVNTRICETAAGIGFGLAVGQGTGDKGVVLGGASFVGISIKDITMNGVPLDPRSNTLGTLDTYPQNFNMGVMTRGHIWVQPMGIVAAHGNVYYSTSTGQFAGSSSGAAGSGSITFTSNPVATKTVTLNGKTITFVASGATGNQVNIAPTLGDTLVALAAFINGSGDTDIGALTAAAYPLAPGGGGVGANQLLISDKTVGTGGNSFTLATNVTGATVSAATLTGGTASATQITGAEWVTSALPGQLAVVSLGIQR